MGGCLVLVLERRLVYRWSRARSFKSRRELEQQASESTDLAICPRGNPKLKPASLASIMAPASLAIALAEVLPLWSNFAHCLGPIH